MAIASGMLVVAAAMIAPLSSLTCSFRHKAERSTAAGANVGSAQVFAQTRQPATVLSRLSSTDSSVYDDALGPQERITKTGASSVNGARSVRQPVCRFERTKIGDSAPSISSPPGIGIRREVARA